jgi:phosphatidylserine decarboxylase
MKLHRLLRREGLTTDKIEWFVNMVKVGAYKIPEIQINYARLKDKVEKIDHKKSNGKTSTGG